MLLRFWISRRWCSGSLRRVCGGSSPTRTAFLRPTRLLRPSSPLSRRFTSSLRRSTSAMPGLSCR
eukprot:03691_4